MRSVKSLRRVAWGFSIAAVVAVAWPLAVRSRPIDAYAFIPASVLHVAADHLSSRFEPTELAGAPIDGVIVLGGGVQRAVVAAELAHMLPEAKLVITGAGRKEIATLRTAEDEARKVIVESNARSTYQNATFTKALLAPKPGQRWLLVTSAIHMPRAIASFHAVGFKVEPWPVDDTPGAQKLLLRLVGHEYLALAAYRLLGRTGTLMPG